MLNKFFRPKLIIGTLPVTLTNGTTADATQVMSDLNWIVNQINANAAPLNSPTFTGTVTTAALNATNITASGTLVVTGTPSFGGVPTTQQTFLTGSAATYTTPTDSNGKLPRQLRIRMKGGGGGGAGSGQGNGNSGTIGTATVFNSIGAAGGSPATNGGIVGGLGGTGGAGSASVRLAGQSGSAHANFFFSGTETADIGGTGGGTGGGPGGVNAVAGTNGAANSGGGGGGGGLGHATFSAMAGYNMVGGGGEGEYVELIINAPSATYTYTVGGGGAGGNAGTNGGAGGNGGSGFIVVDELY